MYNQENLANLKKTDRLPLQAMRVLPNPRRNSQDTATSNGPANPVQEMNTYLDSVKIPNLEPVKARQKATWESVDFGTDPQAPNSPQRFYWVHSL